MTNMHTFARLRRTLVLLLGYMLSIGVVSAAETVTYYHADALGTPVMESNAAGTITYVREHKPFGEQALGGAKNGPAFTGHMADTDTGLTYMQARYYDSTAARFLSTDPVGLDIATGANNNRYRYANNNPYRFSDPDGRQAKSNPNEKCDSECQRKRAEDRRQKRDAPFAPTIVRAGAAAAAAAKTSTAAEGAASASSLSTFLRMLLGRAIITAPLVIGGDSRRESEINIYRVVGSDEYLSIQMMKGYSFAPNGFGVKQFWTNVADAQWFAASEVRMQPEMGSMTRFIVTSKISQQTAAMGQTIWLDSRWSYSFDAAGLQSVNADAQRFGGIGTVRTISPGGSGE